MPVVEKDWITEPLEVLQYLFEQNSESDPTWGVPKYFAEKISKHGLQGVPSLNSIPPWNIPRGSLVRFRCMIQDMFDPEYYLMVYETTNPADKTATVHCGRYTDISHHPPSHAINFDSPKNITEERQTFYCIPLPGETAWAKAAFDSSAAEMEVETTPVRKSKTKRKMATDCDEGPGMQVMNPCSEDSMEMDSPSPVREAVDTHLVPTEKASCELQPAQKRQNEPVSETLFSSQPTSSPPTHHLNFPLPGETGPACLVKLYQGAEDFKLNDVIEVIGVLSVDPMLVHHPVVGGAEASAECLVDPGDMFAETEAERKAHSPPPSLVPRLHCIIAHKLTHSNPLLPSELAVPVQHEVFEPMRTPLVTARVELLDLLSGVLLGDRLAAEYLLLHLLSCVYARTDMMALGKFSLNIFGFPTASAASCVEGVAAAIAQLVTKCHLFPMTLDSMNKGVLCPRKDYEANRLVTGTLQLSDGTHLIVDETSLTAGQLDSHGLQSLSSLNSLIQWQRVPYDFQYHTTDFACNIPVLILSEGKSLLPTDCHLRLTPKEGILNPPMAPPTEDPLKGVTDDQWRRLRTYLGLHRLLAYNLPDHIRSTLEKDFVDMRKADPDTMNADAFHMLLCIARLVSLSYGEMELTLDTWSYVKRLERERRGRGSSGRPAPGQ